MARAVRFVRDLTEEIGGRGLRLAHLGPGGPCAPGGKEAQG